MTAWSAVVAATVVGLAFSLVAQTTTPVAAVTPAAISAYVRLVGASTSAYGWLIIDAPLILYADAAGASHLGVTALPVPYVPLQIRNEVPLPATTPASTGWTLAHVPIGAPTCFRNGLRQAPSIDYQIVGTLISSLAWMSTDVLACDYQF